MLLQGWNPGVRWEYTLMKADEKRKHNYTWAIVRSQCSAICAAGEVLLSFRAHIGFMSKLQAFTLKGIQYFGRLRWLEMRGHLQILYLGQYLKLRLTSLIYNKPFGCRLNGKGSVPIITEGTWPGPFEVGTSSCSAGDLLLHVRTHAHKDLLKAANIHTNLAKTIG